ncbi:MAG: hypothetical protein AAFQ98_00695 [Bacteroidota bacterium]
MGEFDKILKENIEAVFIPISEKLLGIKIASTREVPEKLQTTLEREPDFLKWVTDDAGKEFLLHLEFQTRDEPKMVYRMAEYKALLLRKFEMPVRQFVLFLGRGKSKMKTDLPIGQQITGFELKNLSEVPVDSALNSTVPEEILLAILSDYPVEEAEGVIRRIIERLVALQNDPVTLQRYLQQLIILSRLRKLDKETEEITEQMPITYDVESDAFYLKGLEKGSERQQRATIITMLEEGKLSVEQIARYTQATPEEVVKIKGELS